MISLPYSHGLNPSSCSNLTCPGNPAIPQGPYTSILLFIVQSDESGNKATCSNPLVTKLLSGDKLLSTLYTGGNVLN